jgi:hypothetical protein
MNETRIRLGGTGEWKCKVIRAKLPFLGLLASFGKLVEILWTPA